MTIFYWIQILIIVRPTPHTIINMMISMVVALYLKDLEANFLSINKKFMHIITAVIVIKTPNTLGTVISKAKHSTNKLNSGSHMFFFNDIPLLPRSFLIIFIFIL